VYANHDRTRCRRSGYQWRVGPGDGMVRTHGLTIASFEIVAHGRVGCLLHPTSSHSHPHPCRLAVRRLPCDHYQPQDAKESFPSDNPSRRRNAGSLHLIVGFRLFSSTFLYFSTTALYSGFTHRSPHRFMTCRNDSGLSGYWPLSSVCLIQVSRICWCRLNSLA